MFEGVNWGVREYQSHFVLEKWAKDAKFGYFGSMLGFEVFEFFFLDSFSPHSDDFVDKGVFGDDEGALIVSENFSDLLNLARTDISEVHEDYLLVLSKQGI